jgi:hypothetical protein
VEAVTADDPRVAVRFLDVKHSNPEGIGKKQFVELLLYAHAFASYIDTHGLDDLFYVCVDGHGIWPQRDLNALRLQPSDWIDEAIVPMIWDDHAHLYDYVRDTLRGLWAKAPLPIEDVDVRIQPACSRCSFLSDCKRSLGYDEDLDDMGEVDVRLMPYTSSATSEQLRAMGINTVNDLRGRHEEFASSSAPTPLYAERPLLRLKAEALGQGRRQLPEQHDDRDLRHLSVALPRDCDAIVTFNAEADPTNGCVFALATHLDVRCASSHHAGVHDAWWSAWSFVLERDGSPDERDIEAIRSALDSDARTHVLASKGGPDSEDEIASLERTRIRECARALRVLANQGNLDIRRDADVGGMIAAHTFSFINRGLEEADERALTREAVRTLHALFVVMSVYEELCCVVVEQPWGKVERVGPQAAAFYWSGDQLTHIQDLIERHLTYLMTAPSICGEFSELLLLLAPSESSVQTVYQNKKLLDVRSFVETSVGLPQIINYTWHEVAELELHDGQRVFDRAYWVPNFNYMEFLSWHEMLRSRDVSKAAQLHEQAEVKARTIATLVRYFQDEAAEHGALSKQGKPIPSREIPWRTGAVSERYNAICRAWALYSKLSASVQAQQALVTRLTYPAQSIGKLTAARVSRLFGTCNDQGREQRFTFELHGISANAKFGRGDYVFLIHDSIRDYAFGEHSPSCVIIDEMEWDAGHTLYRVQAHVWRDRYPHPYFDESRPLEPGAWYLYPRSSDSWSPLLFEKRDNLLKRDAIGASWLGQRLSYRLGILANEDTLRAPGSMTFPLSHLYMFAPELLPSPAPWGPPSSTTASPPPDAYQGEAIELALSSAVSCIQGPPGTGKSQTIAALVDEFISKRASGGRPARILITSFSYTPLFVAMERVSEHTDAQGSPTAAASTPMYFYGSEGRDPGMSNVTRIDPYRATVGAVRLDRRRASPRGNGAKMRLEDLFERDDRFIVFANAHQLVRLGSRSGRTPPGQVFEYLHNDFAFDLIVVDEASQMPADAALASVGLVCRGHATLSLPATYAPGDRVEDLAHLEGLRLDSLNDPGGSPIDPDDLTRVVLVGDHNQLPPVRPVDPPEGLRPVLESMFGYYVEHLGVPNSQLAINYRSCPEIVAYTRHLGLYPRRIEAFHEGPRAHPRLPPPPKHAPDWVQHVLDEQCAVSSLIHGRRFETAVSPLEVEIVCAVTLAFYEQLDVSNAERERRFWCEDIGIVAPHNAQGRLMTRRIADALAPRSHLSGAELEEMLRKTIYTVEKFQGSARTFIIASVGVSSDDQLRAEEAFIYSMNRLNVLTSRARQKMLMVCSRGFLDYIPRQRDVVPAAARTREYALAFCNQERVVEVADEHGTPTPVTLRWHDPNSPTGLPPRPYQPLREPEQPVDTAGRDEQTARVVLAAAGLDYDELPPDKRASILAALSGAGGPHDL